MTQRLETWDSADAYDRWIGRWSRKVAIEFFRWLAPSPRLNWVDIGCGSGQLTSCILAVHDPESIVGLDTAEPFVARAHRSADEPHVHFAVADAERLPLSADVFDIAVSGLVLNFVPDHLAMMREMARVTKPGGTVAAYVWDYARGMQMIRHFWDAARAVNGEAAQLDQAERFPICRADALATLLRQAGLLAVEVRAIDVPTVFRDFDDYWAPFLGRQGAAATYLASLDDEARDRIKSLLRSRLAPVPGPIELTARAWTVRGLV